MPRTLASSSFPNTNLSDCIDKNVTGELMKIHLPKWITSRAAAGSHCSRLRGPGKNRWLPTALKIETVSVHASKAAMPGR